MRKIKASVRPAQSRTSKPDAPEYSALVPWIAFFTLPLVVFGERAAYVLNRAAGAGFGPDRMIYGQMAGMAFASVLVVLFGPHLITGLGLALVIGGTAGLVYLGSEWAHLGAMIGHGATLVGVLAAMGVSATGGTPGLRYAMVFGLYAMSNLAYALVPLLPDGFPWAGIAMASVGLLILPVPTVSWWFVKKRPRPPDEGATWRVAGATLLLVVLLLSARAVWALLTPIRTPADPTSTYGILHSISNPVTVITVTLLTIPVLLVLQALKKPARVGVLSGVGALIMSLAAVLTWSMGDGTPAILMLVLVACGEVFIYPWAYARMVSDAHWRLTGMLAFAAMVPRLLVQNPETLTAVGAAMVLALLAIPIGALGWFADEWIFGDDLGPESNLRR
jgi:hypothetical protein